LHIYASIISPDNSSVLLSCFNFGRRVRNQVSKQPGGGGNKAAASLVGKLVAEKAKQKGIEKVAFDRSGFMFHGRVKALGDAARESGLVF
jgi:large subunit ribosomal protein L18